MKRVLFLGLVLVLAVASATWATEFASNRHIFINVANDAGVKYNYDGATYGGPTNTYYIKSDGGGLGSNHITSDPTNLNGQTTVVNTTSNSVSGTFWANDTGGRGFTDNTILMISSPNPFTRNFSITLSASGYAWTPSPVNGQPPTSYTYVNNAFSETFGGNDFIYTSTAGTNSKPGPGTLGALPYYYGDRGTGYYSMFVDLGLGMLNAGKQTTGGFVIPADLTDKGAVKVGFSVNNLYSDVVFNMYGWALNSNQAEGINWTNTTNSSTSSNGYVIQYDGLAPAPVPVPPSVLLLAGGLGGLGVIRKRWTKK